MAVIFFFCQHQQSYILHNYLWKLSDLLASLNDNKICILFLLYLSSAIERTDHEILLSCHEHDFGICGTALNWFWSCLSDRKQYVLVNNQKSTATSLDFGVPQAFVLSPVLFILYTTYRLHHKALCHERERERVCVCVCMRACVSARACMCGCMHACVSFFGVECAHACDPLCVCVHVRVCVHTCVCIFLYQYALYEYVYYWCNIISLILSVYGFKLLCFCFEVLKLHESPKVL